jgi:hypothetical protein
VLSVVVDEYAFILGQALCGLETFWIMSIVMNTEISPTPSHDNTLLREGIAWCCAGEMPLYSKAAGH